MLTQHFKAQFASSSTIHNKLADVETLLPRSDITGARPADKLLSGPPEDWVAQIFDVDESHPGILALNWLVVRKYMVRDTPLAEGRLCYDVKWVNEAFRDPAASGTTSCNCPTCAI
jgi:hypothetical protein